MLHLKVIGEGAYHIFADGAEANMLSRYGILKPDAEQPDDGCARLEGDTVTLEAGRSLTVRVEKKEKGYILTMPLADGERLYGGGDSTRDGVMIRGKKLEMHISNVVSYGPMGVILSTGGWAFVLNCTYKSIFDLGSTENGVFSVETFGGVVDFYLFRGDSLRQLLSRVTLVTGRPTLLPKFAYGLTLVENEQIDARGLLWDIKALRDRNIPCDTVGLEPSWMSKYYDYSVDKAWNKERFYLPYWMPDNQSGSFTFFYAMRKMGMQLSLWLCENYDLLYEEDQEAAKDEALTFGADADILDANFCAPSLMDKITKLDEPWFEHLKKFVDNGAAAFKLDGSDQVLPHPDRLWGRKYLDEEVHNIYPVLLAKQMEKGFHDYTDRRLLLYTAGAFLGTQQYAATWAGDTGGGPRSAVSLMNYAMCGHSNTSCDIDVDPAGIHFGFLTPWAQYFCWSSWKYPWFMGDEIEKMVSDYANLRSSLVPYLYTMAHKAYATGLPMLRPLALMYENDPRMDRVTNAYMLGDSLYVGAFNMDLTLPEGRWVDYFTGDVYEGDIHYQIPEGKGGALFAKEGSILVTMVPQQYILEKAHDYVVKVFPGKDCSFSLYEDDGFSYDYREGGFASTTFEVKDTAAEGFALVIHPREGSFAGKPDNGHDILRNSIPRVDPMGPERDMTVSVQGRVASVTLNGQRVPTAFDGRETTFTAPLASRDNAALVFELKY